MNRLGGTFGRRLSGLLDRRLSDDVVRDWGFLWARVVLSLRKPTIVGITGSAGKTTTTEAVGAVLRHPRSRARVGPVRTTSENMNNYVGLPLVVLGYRGWAKTRWERARFLVTAPWRALASALSRGYPRVLVLEYGTDRSGYMKPMVELAPPTIAVVTTIGPAHLAGMGSLEGVVREKSVLVRYADPRGLVVVGDGHPFVADIVAQSSAPVVTVGGRGLDLAANVARVVAERLGVPAEVVVEALGGLKLPKSRLNWLRIGELAVLDDSYNANPLSMKLGLDTLASEAPRGGRKVTILGTMAELGEHEERYHREIGEYARGVADVLVGVGGPAKAYAADHWFEDAAACAEHVEQIVRPGDTILVKASASVGLGLVVERLTRAAAVGARD